MLSQCQTQNHQDLACNCDSLPDVGLSVDLFSLSVAYVRCYSQCSQKYHL